MVRQESYAQNDWKMNQYKTRTAYGGSTHNHPQNPSKTNHVQVAHSSGCCCSNKSNNISTQPVIARAQTPRITAHERAHERLDSPDPFQHYRGRIYNNPNRKKNLYQRQTGKNKIHSTVQTTYVRQPNTTSNPHVQSKVPIAKKQSSCCTIL